MSQLVETLIIENIIHIYTGDFNIHLNSVDNPGTCTFSELLECFDLKIHTNFATCPSGNTVDLFISDNGDMIQHVDKGCQFSSHLPVNFEVTTPRPSYNKINISSWKIMISTLRSWPIKKVKLDGI